MNKKIHKKISKLEKFLHIDEFVKKTDSSWPLSVWVVKGKPYSVKILKDVLNKIRIAFK